jgi:hypothetical protein
MSVLLFVNFLFQRFLLKSRENMCFKNNRVNITISLKFGRLYYFKKKIVDFIKRLKSNDYNCSKN